MNNENKTESNYFPTPHICLWMQTEQLKKPTRKFKNDDQ